MTDAPRVLAIHTAKGSRLPMREVSSIEAEAGFGLVGDRYHGTKHRHVTLQSRTQLDVAEAAFGAPISSAATRRNVTITHGELPTKPGTKLTIGDVELEVVRVAAPCRLLEDVIGRGAMKTLRFGRAGTVFRLLTSGTIAVGDAVAWDDPTA